VSQWSWSYEALQHQADQRQGATLARNPVAVLPRVPGYAAGLNARVTYMLAGFESP